MRTEIAFTLPVGLVDGAGETHREGVMRLATARDELEPLRDPRVARNQAYLSVLLLERTVLRIGGVAPLSCDVLEGLFAADFDYLQRLYERVNTPEPVIGTFACPACHETVDVDLTGAQDGPSGK